MEYHVFLTPNGDCKGLYIAAKTPTSFEVRELGGGTSSVRFDSASLPSAKTSKPSAWKTTPKTAAPIEAMKKAIHRAPMNERAAASPSQLLVPMK